MFERFTRDAQARRRRRPGGGAAARRRDVEPEHLLLGLAEGAARRPPARSPRRASTPTRSSPRSRPTSSRCSRSSGCRRRSSTRLRPRRAPTGPASACTPSARSSRRCARRCAARTPDRHRARAARPAARAEPDARAACWRGWTSSPSGWPRSSRSRSPPRGAEARVGARALIAWRRDVLRRTGASRRADRRAARALERDGRARLREPGGER